MATGAEQVRHAALAAAARSADLVQFLLNRERDLCHFQRIGFSRSSTLKT